MNSTTLPAGVEDGPVLSTDAANRSSLTAELRTTTCTDEPTLASTWLGVAGIPIADELLEWPADLFALTDVLLDRADAYRFVSSPPDGGGGRQAASALRGDDLAARPLRELVQRGRGRGTGVVCLGGGPHPSVPSIVGRGMVDGTGAASMPLEQLAQGQDWRVCEALLILHTIADEACAGLFAALDRSDGRGFLYRARGRELLARTGSLARIPSHLVRVLPKVSTPRDGGANSPGTRACSSQA